MVEGYIVFSVGPRVTRRPDVVQESILPNINFFIFEIFAFKLGHFKVQTIFYFLMLHTFKLNNKKWKKNLCFTKKKVR